MSQHSALRLTPAAAIEGGRISIHGQGFDTSGPSLPKVHVDRQPARVVFASPTRIDALVPALSGDSPVSVRVDGTSAEGWLDVGAVVASGLHQVDSPAVDTAGNLFFTYSGTRGQHVPVSLFRVGAGGTRDSFSSNIPNPTSMAFDGAGQLYVSSRFEGVVYRVSADGHAERFVSELGVACGMAFGPDGTLYVGDRTGTVFAVDRAGRATVFATLPPSVAAFHLALGGDGLYVTGPTLAPNDVVYRIAFDGHVEVFCRGFGRPQGLAFDARGTLHVVEAVAGGSALLQVNGADPPKPIVAAAGLIGVAFDRAGALVLCTRDTAFRVARVA